MPFSFTKVAEPLILKGWNVTKVKTHRGSDGEGFNAELLFNRERVAHVLNDGGGGCNIYYWMKGKEAGNEVAAKQFRDDCKALPVEVYEGITINPDEDMGMDYLTFEFAMVLQIKKLAKKEILFLKADETLEVGEKVQYRRWKTPYSAAAASALRAKFPACRILNEELQYV